LQSNRPLPPEQLWDTNKYLNFIPQLFQKAREKYGADIELLHDVHSRLTPIEAAKLGKTLELFNLLFLEDSVTAENQAGYHIIRQHTTTPLAVGEVFNSIWDAKQLIENQSIDYLRAAATHAGVNIWAPNFGIQEFVGFGSAAMNEVFKHPLTYADGHLLLNDKPGLGVDFDKNEADKYPYKRSYLPVSRLEDGTLWNW